ncbi:SpoIIE family protein phosphatase [Streptomyces sp. 8K308]|uniref:SpoIIE family protein phosphatase n=1 Tax=Streptomyces sp. 8K308 TaxID=2530388 RepID=UPI001FB6636C|nr:SpoIIE family protein phosphatase [Streptomyces sp. 8K308]
MGEWLRRNGGVAAEIAEHHDNWARLGLAQASAATCGETEIPAEIPLVLLMSDGIPDHVGHEGMEQLCRELGDRPQDLADALVATVKEDDGGYRDDATMVALLRS